MMRVGQSDNRDTGRKEGKKNRRILVFDVGNDDSMPQQEYVDAYLRHNRYPIPTQPYP